MSFATSLPVMPSVDLMVKAIGRCRAIIPQSLLLATGEVAELRASIDARRLPPQ